MAHGSLTTPFGPLTVYADDGAVTALGWGWAPCGLLGPVVLQALDELDAYCAGERVSFSVPLRPAGTAFQRRVWRRLVEIPYGSTISYGALARELGTAPRAIAQACAHNPLPIFIPCHRVVAADGALGGYSGAGGSATKRALLALETGRRPQPQKRTGPAA